MENDRSMEDDRTSEESMENDGGSYGGGGKTSKKKKKAKPEQTIRLTESDERYPTVKHPLDLPEGTKNIDFDWCDRNGVVREVMDQGNRRTCWTIASTRSLSARLVIENRFNHPLCLSALHLLVGLINVVDARGGLRNPDHLRKFLIDHGTVLEEDCKCPQLALEDKNNDSKPDPELCTDKGKSKDIRKFKVADLVILDKVDEKELMRLVTSGPVVVGIDVYSDFTTFKGDGIYTGLGRKGRIIDKHLFLLTGHGTKMPEGTHYWKVQNSAGTTWGNNGYGKIIRQTSLCRGAQSLFTCIIYPRLLNRYEGQL